MRFRFWFEVSVFLLVAIWVFAIAAEWVVFSR